MKGVWTYLYRAVDSLGQTIDFLLSARRDAAGAKRFFRKALAQPHTINPRTIAVDKNPAYPKATAEMKRTGDLWRFSRLRQCKYLNNIVEQDHRRIKRLVRPGLGFGSLPTARRTLAGYEAMAMIRKGQVQGIGSHDMPAQTTFVADLFKSPLEIAALQDITFPTSEFATEPGIVKSKQDVHVWCVIPNKAVSFSPARGRYPHGHTSPGFSILSLWICPCLSVAPALEDRVADCLDVLL